MLRCICQEKTSLLLETLAALAAAAVSVLLSFAMGDMVNAAVGGDIPALGRAALVCVACLGAQYVLQAAEMFFRKRLSGRCVRAAKARLYTALENMDVGEFHTRTDSAYLNLMQGDMETLERDCFSALGRVLSLSARALFCAAALLSVSRRLFAIFAVLSLLPQAAGWALKGPLQRAKTRFSQRNVRCVQRGRELVEGFDTIQYFSAAPALIRRLEAEDAALEDARGRRDVCERLTAGGTTALNMAASILCMAAAAWCVAVGELAIGALTASTQLLNYTFTPLSAVAEGCLSIRSTRGLWKKLDDLCAAASPKTEDRPVPSGDLCLEGVTVRRGGRAVLSDLSWTFRAGGRYAVIGPSGSGKTTLAKTLLGTVRPEAGRVTVGGTDLRELDLRAWRRRALYVPQEAFLFQGTVVENIGFFSDAEAAERAGLRAALPREVLTAQTGSDQGRFLSGGERTRLSVARALRAGADILIFDEPTGGLDPETAREIETLILGIRDKTVIVITHNWDRDHLGSFDGVLRVE